MLLVVFTGETGLRVTLEEGLFCTLLVAEADVRKFLVLEELPGFFIELIHLDC